MQQLPVTSSWPPLNARIRTYNQASRTLYIALLCGSKGPQSTTILALRPCSFTFPPRCCLWRAGRNVRGYPHINTWVAGSGAVAWLSPLALTLRLAATPSITDAQLGHHSEPLSR